MKNFKNLFILMLMALVLFVAVGCDGSKIELSFEKQAYTVEIGKELTLLPAVVNEDGIEYVLVYSSGDDSIATFVNGVVKGIAEGEVEVKVVWEKNNKVSAEAVITVIKTPEYKVMFNVDGGSDVAAATIVSGNKVAKPADPTKEGHVFLGWYKEALHTNLYDFNSPVTGALVLYAKWELAEYSVEFDSNGGSDVESVGAFHGDKVTKPADPTKLGYTFKGWFADEELEAAYDFNADVVEDLVLYAKWEIVQYNLAFVLNGGEDGEQFNNAKYTVEDADITLPVPVRTNYDFMGWYDNHTFAGEAWTVIEKGSTVDFRFYAKWELTKHAVEFDSNEGSAVATQNVTHGEKAEVPAAPTKADFVFGAWFSDAALTQLFDFNVAIEAPIKLYAKWIAEAEIKTATFKWEYENKDLEVTSFLYDFYIWLDSKDIIDSFELSFVDFAGHKKTGDGLETKFIGEWIKYIGLTGDAISLGTEYWEGSINHLRVVGTRETAPLVINEDYFLNSSVYNAKWAQYGNWINDETKTDMKRFWSEAVGMYDFLRYVTGLSFTASVYVKVGGGADYNMGEFELEVPYHAYSNVPMLEVTLFDYTLSGWKLAADGSGDFVTALPYAEPVDLDLFAMFAPPAQDADESIYVKQGLTGVYGQRFEYEGLSYYYGINAFSTLEEGLANIERGMYIDLDKGLYLEDVTIPINQVNIVGNMDGGSIIAGRITLDGVSTVFLEFLEFTGLGQVFSSKPVDDFIFARNKVYDITIAPSPYAPANRIGVNAFIQLYTGAGGDQIGKITIEKNTFNNISSDIISIDRTTADKEIKIVDNEFLNFGVSVFRVDGGYNGGTYNILRNNFENDVLGASAALVFRCYSAIEGKQQFINIEDNTFKNIGDVDNQVMAGTHPASGVITFSVWNEEHVRISIKRNVFEHSVNSIHLRNNGHLEGDWGAEINFNQFLDPIGYVYYEEEDAADLTNNYLEDADGVAITDTAEVEKLILTNTSWTLITKP